MIDKLKNITPKGERNEAYSGNAFTLKCMRVTLFVFFITWILDVLNIFIVDLKIMTTALVSSAIIVALAHVYAFVKGIDTRVSCYVIMAAMVAMVTAITTEMAYHTLPLMIFPLVCSAQYFDKKITWFTFITSCVGYYIDVMVGYKIGLCDSNMLLLTYTNSAYHTALLESGEFTINTNKFLMFLFFVFPRWLLMYAMMPLLNHVASDIQMHTAREEMARHLAEMDGLTGIYNRTKYLELIDSHYRDCDNVAVLFMDVNNLKTVNDNMGHEYGDMLICGLADELKKRESDTCKAFRLGGDEFVMILEGKEAENADAFLKKLDSDLQGKNLGEGINLSVAIGMSSGKGADIDTITGEADDRMYKQKAIMKAE